MRSEPSTTAELYCSACERMFDTSVGEACPRDGTRLVKLVAAQDPYLGRDLDGRYVILTKLGQGGMGAVYRANQKSVDREVAIKVVSPQMMTEPAIIKRFLREARLASRINHPNAVAVLDFGQTADGVFYLVMELVTGRTLESILRTEGTLSAERAIQIATQICLALEGAHAVPIVHRDLKPANVLVGANDLVKVLDFGIAKSLSRDTISTTMTNAGAIMGTPGFMSPEVALSKPCDERTDLYSLGCLLYLAVSGRLPFDADALPEILMKHVSSPVPPLPVTVPPALAQVIYRLMQKDPGARFASAGETRLALERVSSRPATSLPWGDAQPAALRSSLQTPTIRAPAPARAKRAMWPWALAALVAGGVGVAAAIAMGTSEPSTGGTSAAPAPAPAVAPATAPIPAAPAPAVAPPTPTVAVPEPASAVEPPRVADDPVPAKPTTRPVPKKSIAKPIARPVAKPSAKPVTKPVTPVTPPRDEDPPPF